MLEEEKLQQQSEIESNSSGDEQENPLQNLLSSFSNTTNLQMTAIDSNSESDICSDKDDDIGKNDKETNNLTLQLDNKDEKVDSTSDEDIKIKEIDEEDPETAQEDAGYLKDPFSIHLHDDLSDKLYEAVSNIPQIMETQKITWPALGNLICEISKSFEDSKDTKKSNISVLEHKQFAKCEMCNLMQEANQNPRSGSESNMTVTVLYCKYDIMQLSAIVGTQRANQMLGSEKSIHMIMTGE
ncbi:digestive organ expansion factor [Apis mellifera caucasica]|nr:digestive organ expansion factor [Apis mellifera caucasica]